MKLTVGDRTITILGDPHLGKMFVSGVPLDRRGEREAEVWRDFKASLDDVEGSTMHVCMGDLFDKFTVPAKVVLDTAAAYLQAAMNHPDVQYVVIMGNHDQVRDTDKRSSFDLFCAIVCEAENIVLVAQKPELIDGLLFVPWSPWKTAQEMIDERRFPEERRAAVFGHWEIKSFGGEDENLCPYETLAGITDLIVTGHIHAPEEFTHPLGPKVVVTGSLQPYTHAEDPNGDRYVTLTLDQLEKAGDLSGKCVRVRLLPGEDLPEGINCAQLTVQRVASTEEPSEDIGDVEIESFNFAGLFQKVFQQEGVDAPTTGRVWEAYQGMSHDQDA